MPTKGRVGPRAESVGRSLFSLQLFAAAAVAAGDASPLKLKLKQKAHNQTKGNRSQKFCYCQFPCHASSI